MNDCDNCGNTAELYYNEATGLALCEDCDAAEVEDDTEVEAEGFHAELRQIIENVEGTDLAALIPHAEALLALPEESVAALVAAAQSMVGAASFAQGSRAYVTDESGNPQDLYTGEPLDL